MKDPLSTLIVKTRELVLGTAMSAEGSSDMDCQDLGDTIETDKLKESILDCVAESDGYFKSQQVGEKDLTFSEKREIASDLLDKNMHMFLQRYWKFIKLEDVPFFGDSDDYEVKFYLSEIRKQCDSKAVRTRIKNRRYEAMKKLVQEGSYFSDGEMKRRNPFMFDRFIGKHLTEKERTDAYKETLRSSSFAGFLMGQFDRNVENCLFNEQQAKDEACIEEQDSDESEEESELESEDEDCSKVTPVSDIEKSRLRSEFTNIMYESFLSGKDIEFDYSSVDHNAEYDPLGDLDAEEKYFDKDSSDEN